MQIAFIGFGEAAQAFVSGWQSENIAGLAVASYDILFEDADARDHKRAECAALSVRAAASAPDAITGATAVFCAVTADRILEAADSALPALGPGQLYLDCDSSAPFKKAEAARRIEATGARYVDVAVMDPVHPKRHKVPLLISGSGALEAGPLLGALGMSYERVSERTGDASTLKMIRSIAIKGMESVAMECFLAAHALGIEARIMPSITSYLARFPDYRALADYVSERVTVHGQRRAAEMREVAETLAHHGFSSFLPAATAAHQQWVTDLGVKAHFGNDVPRDAQTIAQAILELQGKALPGTT